MKSTLSPVAVGYFRYVMLAVLVDARCMLAYAVNMRSAVLFGVYYVRAQPRHSVVHIKRLERFLSS